MSVGAESVFFKQPSFHHGRPKMGKPDAGAQFDAPRLALHAILQRGDAFLVRAMSATEKRPGNFNAVPDDFTVAMLAMRRQGMNGALEAIEKVRFTVHNDFDRFVIFVSADFTAHHKFFSPFYVR
jgi:hypothetical protein